MATWLVLLESSEAAEIDLWQVEAETCSDALDKAERRYTHVERSKQDWVRAVRLDSIPKIKEQK